ncbi:galactose oxidase early set domain-containing protein [Roseateles sp. BYS180W]|uniref:Galactose oxidase early set domain-containing protein n=1 Tax=Roseateles rivi TaxID=3299028 RepID=A0ABW7FXJ6_9BURK
MEDAPGRSTPGTTPRPRSTSAPVAMPALGAVPPADASAAAIGKWSAPFDTGVVAIHASLMPGGSLMLFGTELEGVDAAPDKQSLSFVSLNPGSTFQHFGKALNVSSFCAGNIGLSDGSLFIVGGTGNWDNNRTGGKYGGANLLARYSEGSGRIDRYGTSLHKPRWYPSTLDMPDGSILVAGGTDDQGVAVAAPEVVNPADGSSRLLTGIDMANKGWSYPRMFATSNNDAIMLGNDQRVYKLTVTGTGRVQEVSTSQRGKVPLGPAVQVGNKQLLVAGARQADGANNLAKLVTVSNSGISVEDAGTMNIPRVYHELTVLPDGTALATGGNSSTDPDDLFALNKVVYAAERWTSGKGWKLMASAAGIRSYHSTALLLPDGSVAKMGSNRPKNMPNYTGEIFYPPYLYNNDGSVRARPIINSVTRSSLAPRAPLVVTVTPASGKAQERITSLSMVRIGSATHQRNFGQRYVKLSFSRRGNVLTANLPQSAIDTPAGHYMVFALDSRGTPSIAKIVKIG